ncbi:MAG: DUF6020 family protein [Lachnospiraceae bacterium]|nr:DUF6020 family protein [Lachnospiraceae bacterium]
MITPGVIIDLIIAYAVVIISALVSGYGITRIDIVLPLEFLAVFLLLEAVRRKVSGKEALKLYSPAFLWKNAFCRNAGLLTGSIFALTVVVGRHVEVYSEICFTEMGGADILLALLLIPLFSYLFMSLFSFIEEIGGREAVSSGLGRSHRFRLSMLAFLIILLAYLPYYLNNYPGNLGKDTFEEVKMCLGLIPWTNHHPFFYTGLIDLIIKLTSGPGSLTLSLGVFTYVQMCLYIVTLVYILNWMERHGFRKIWIAAAFVFFAFHPFMPMYAIYASKDTLFACATVLMCLAIYDERPIAMGVFGLLTMLLRNNGIFMVAALFIYLIFCKKAGRLKSIISVGTALIAFIIAGSVATNCFGVAKGSFAESMGVPLQQMGYCVVYSGDNIEEEDLAYLERLMPLERVKEVYTPGLSDPYKFDEAFDDELVNENKGEFLKVWFHMLTGNFADYVKAYLVHTSGYWHFGESNTVVIQSVCENDMGVDNINLLEDILKLNADSIIEGLMLGMRKAPLLNILSSMAMELWGIVILTVVTLRRKRRIGYLIPLLALWVTIMLATPAYCLFRYMYPCFILWPVTLGLIFDPSVRNGNDQSFT